MWIRTIASGNAMTRTVTEVVFIILDQKGMRPLIAPLKSVEPDPTPQPKSTSLAEVDVPAEIEDCPWFRNVGRFLMPTPEMANSFPKTGRIPSCVASLPPALFSEPGATPAEN